MNEIMKQIYLKIFVLLLFCMVGGKAMAYDACIDDIYYNFNSAEKTAEVTYLEDNDNENAYSGDVVIPSSISFNGENYTVTSVGRFAFCKCRTLTSITIPNSVTTIGEDAFKDCRALTKLVFGNSVTTIDRYAFNDCSGLASIVIPNSVTTIERQAFCDCIALTSVTIGSGVTCIDEEAFRNCYNLQTVVSLIEEPFDVDESFFECSKKDKEENRIDPDLVYNIATLYVPVGTQDQYAQKEGWRKFLHIEETNLADIVTAKATDRKDCLQKISLSGQRLTAPHKGISIVGGKKVVVK